MRPITITRPRRVAPGPAVALLLASLLAWSASARTAAPVGDDDLAALMQLKARFQWAQADSLASALIARMSVQPDADSLQFANLLYQFGEVRWQRASFADGKAQAALRRCLGIRQRVLGAAHPDVAGTHIMLGRILGDSGQLDSSLVHYERGRELYLSQSPPNDTLLANAYLFVGLAHRNKRDYTGAIQEFQQALALRERAQGQNVWPVASILAQTGLCLTRLGRLEEAHATLEQSLAILDRCVGPTAMKRVIPLDYLSGVESELGNQARALDLSLTALRIARSNRPDDDAEVMRMRFNLVNALYSFSDWAGMGAILDPLLPWSEARRGPDDRRTLELHVMAGVAAAGLGDTASALVHLRRVEHAIAAKPGAPGPDPGFALAWQARVLQREGMLIDALATCDRGLRYARAESPPSRYGLALLYFTKLEVLCALGDRAALDSTGRALEQLADQYELRRTSSAPVVDYWEAQVAQRLGRRDEAWAHALEAFRASHEQVTLNARALPDGRALSFSDDDARMLEVVLDFARGDPQRLEAAWDRLVRTRGLVRAELARRRLPRSLRGDTALVGAHTEWLKAQRAYARELVQSAGAAADSATTARLAELSEATEAAEREYVATLQRHRASPPPPEVGLVDVLHRLVPKQTLVSFAEISTGTDSARALAYVARGGERPLAQVDLGRSDALRAVLQSWLSAIARRDDEPECRQLGLAVRRAIWDPIAARVGLARDLFLVPDGPLLDVPWQALPTEDRGYLVDAGPCLHVLNAEWELASPRKDVAAGSMLAVGDPDFEEVAPAEAVAAQGIVVASLRLRSSPDPCAGEQGLVLSALPASGVEARGVAKTWRAGGHGRTAEVLEGAAASELTVKREAPGRAILHFATHGIVTQDTCRTRALPAATASTMSTAPAARGVGGVAPVADPPPPPVSPWLDRRVWLALAGANHAREHTADENEGLLTAEEVITLDLEGTDWVVLSACHTGWGNALPREGTLGLRRAFQLAGARTVIASGWAVEDASAREWMAALYEARRAGAPSAAAAIQGASRAVLAARRHDGRSTHPFYWAAFTATGE